MPKLPAGNSKNKNSLDVHLNKALHHEVLLFLPREIYTFIYALPTNLFADSFFNYNAKCSVKQ